MPKPTVGRIVHFYDKTLKDAPVSHNNHVNLNGQGVGPYPALVIQDFPGPYVNLYVFAYGGWWSEGSVSEFDEKTNASKYWAWPPKDEPKK